MIVDFEQENLLGRFTTTWFPPIRSSILVSLFSGKMNSPKVISWCTHFQFLLSYLIRTQTSILHFYRKKTYPYIFSLLLYHAVKILLGLSDTNFWFVDVGAKDEWESGLATNGLPARVVNNYFRLLITNSTILQAKKIIPSIFNFVNGGNMSWHC